MVAAEEWVTVSRVERNGLNLDSDVRFRDQMATTTMVEQACPEEGFHRTPRYPNGCPLDEPGRQTRMPSRKEACGSASVEASFRVPRLSPWTASEVSQGLR
jgi:hypothetical protein